MMLRVVMGIAALWLTLQPAWATGCPQADAAGDPAWQKMTATTVQLSQKTAWQPVGQKLLLSLDSQDPILNEDIAVCFRWILENGFGEWQSGPRVRVVDVQNKTATFSVAVPAIAKPTSGRIANTFYFVHDAEAMVMVRQNDKLSAYVVPFGVSHGSMGALSVGLFLLFIFSLFYMASPRRPNLTIPQRASRAVLYVISSGAKGSASLSQFQLILWLCAVGCCIVDVMVLSGELIPVPDQLLGLLGISSGAFIGAKVMDDTPSTPLPAVPSREPAWRDMIEVNGVVDVTRLQMLVFTVVTALFVIMRTFAAYEFPNLDNSYLVLMGIANGSYLLGKVKTTPAVPPPAAPTPGAA